MNESKRPRTRMLAGSLLCLAAGLALGGGEKLMVTQVTRISHPAYDVSNMWQSSLECWNRDGTRIMMYQGPFVHPEYFKPGTRIYRGLLWGRIAELKAASGGSLEQYHKAVHRIPDFWCRGTTWSIFPTEEACIYGLYTPKKMVAKLNVDTGVRTDIVSYERDDGTEARGPWLMGWTKDGNLVINCNGQSAADGQFEIDLDHAHNHAKAKRKLWKKVPKKGTPRWYRFPYGRSIHGSRSPDGKYRAHYSARPKADGVDIMDPASPRFGDLIEDPFNAADDITHVDWRAANGWFVGCSVQFTPGRKRPAIVGHRLFQVLFDRATEKFWHNLLHIHDGAGLYRHENSSTVNYHAMMTPTLRKDGRQVMYMSTDGKYSTQDRELFGSTPWGTRGVFLADLAPAQAKNVTPPRFPAR